MNPTPIEYHDTEIQRNRIAWERKALLRKIYAGFYSEIIAQLKEDAHGEVVELGSGIGNFKELYPKAIATDIFPNPWIDRVEDAYRLSFPDCTISNLILFDVFHHLTYPGSALSEWKRVLVKDGRVIIFEPYISIFGFLVYALLHHESVSFFRKISWFNPKNVASNNEYYAAQGNATRIFRIGSSYKKEIRKEWNIVNIKKYSALSYVLSGGFSKPALYPESLLPFIRIFERVLDLFPIIFATRVLIVLEKK